MEQHKERLLRLPAIIGQSEITPQQAEANRKAGKRFNVKPRPAIQPLLPISRAAFYAGVKSGKYPQPLKLGTRTSAWRESDILKIVNGEGLE